MYKVILIFVDCFNTFGKKMLYPTGYKGVSKDGISIHKFRHEWKSKIHRRGGGGGGDFPRVIPSQFDQVVLHTSQIYIEKRRDKQRKYDGTKLKYPFLKDDTYSCHHLQLEIK